MVATHFAKVHLAAPGDTLSQTQQRGPKKIPRAPHLFLEIECERPLEGPARHRLAEVDCVRLGRGPRRSASRANARVLELSVPDGWMSKSHAELVRGPDGCFVRDLGSKNCSFMDGLKLDAPAQLSDESRLQLCRTF